MSSESLNNLTPSGEESTTSGWFNKIINNLPCEIHVPGYRFLGKF